MAGCRDAMGCRTLGTVPGVPGVARVARVARVGKPDTPIYLCNRISEKGKEVFALEQVTIYQSSLASNN